MGFPCLGMSHTTDVFGVFFIYTQNYKETPSEGTEDPAAVVLCLESFQSGENVL